MFGMLMTQMRSGAERRMRDAALAAGVVSVAGLFALVSLGFATFAGYEALRAAEGPVLAAAIVATFFAAIAIAIAMTWGLRRSARRSASDAAVAARATPAGGEAPAAGDGPPQAALSRAVLLEAVKMGRDPSPMQVLGVALAGGLFVGRSLRR